MKNASIILIAVTAAFCFAMIGLFIGRASKDGAISVYTQGSSRSETQDIAETKPKGLININTATSEELQELPGIGESTAEAIINYREENGPFLFKKDIMNVSGIGEKTYQEFESMICVKDDS